MGLHCRREHRRPRLVAPLLAALTLFVACGDAGAGTTAVTGASAPPPAGVRLTGQVELLTDTAPGRVPIPSTVLVVAPDDEAAFWRAAGYESGPPESPAEAQFVATAATRDAATASAAAAEDRTFAVDVAPGSYLLCVAGLQPTLTLEGEPGSDPLVSGCARTRPLDGDTAVTLAYSPTTRSVSITYG